MDAGFIPGETERLQVTCHFHTNPPSRCALMPTVVSKGW